MGKRLVVLPWTCQRSGHCCEAIGEVVMRNEERIAIEAYLDRTDLPFASAVEAGQVVPGFVALKAHPCPLLAYDKGLAVCTVYPVRPYNCRRWGCFRPDPRTEPLEPDAGFLGAACVRERFEQSREVRRALELMQRKAKRWGRNHGWTDTQTEES